MATPKVPSIHLAIEYGDEAIFNAILSMCDDVDARDPITGRTPLHMAVSFNNLNFLNGLLLRGANVNVFSNSNLTPLHLAVRHKSAKMVEILLNHGADINPDLNFDGKTPLYMAVEFNCPKIVEILLARGASIKHSTIREVTVFDVAWKIRNVQMCDLLLKYAFEQFQLRLHERRIV